jgi:hypothetical protein
MSQRAGETWRLLSAFRSAGHRFPCGFVTEDPDGAAVGRGSGAFDWVHFASFLQSVLLPVLLPALPAPLGFTSLRSSKVGPRPPKLSLNFGSVRFSKVRIGCRIEIADGEFAPREREPLIVAERREPGDARARVEHRGEEVAAGAPRPLEVDLCRRDPPCVRVSLRVRRAAGDRAGERSDRIRPDGIADREPRQPVAVCVPGGGPLALRRARAGAQARVCRGAGLAGAGARPRALERVLRRAHLARVGARPGALERIAAVRRDPRGAGHAAGASSSSSSSSNSSSSIACRLRRRRCA